MKTSLLLWLTAIFTVANAHAALQIVVSQGEEENLPVLYDTTDLLHGLIATELPGDMGWHEAVSDPADKLPAFTDGEGIRATGLTGLLNDFPGPGNPAKRIEYVLPSRADIAEIRVFTGNNGRDGRVFHTYTVSFSSDDGQNFTPPIYVQSHPSGTLNTSQVNNWRVVLSQLSDDAGPLASGATHIRFDFYSVDNTGGEMRDPFNGENPFTGADDGFSPAFVSPLVWEIDVIEAAQPPRLESVRVGGDLHLNWIGESDYLVETATELPPVAWIALEPQPPVSTSGNTNTVTLAIEPGTRFFRLRREP